MRTYRLAHKISDTEGWHVWYDDITSFKYQPYKNDNYCFGLLWLNRLNTRHYSDNLAKHWEIRIIDNQTGEIMLNLKDKTIKIIY